MFQEMMTTRSRRMIWGGAISLPLIAISLLIVVRRSAIPRSEFGQPAFYWWATTANRADLDFAPIQFSWEAPPGVKGYWRVREAERFTLLNGEAFVGDEHLPRERITDYLNEKVRRAEIEYVVVFPAKGSKWGDLFPVLDECRKSEVRIVLLNQIEI
ncbi:hypothetical protein [Actomonas aquatica]|uniref:Uncharacterized protein n=1 Tax=Actomonas aquatica TaxID=2866162 RepID=A0ABZ1CDG9_9BACT|nr:hypothetical protein [Opitutus sp. WL0086]WRQ89332.1 hypothetical protein K1X11_007920 [Opitutus sp. WL0086]